jgi:hypothetical protein
MTSGAFRLRPYRDGDGASINDGFNEVFGHTRPLEEWRWKFQPESAGCSMILAVDASDRVVAHFAVQRVPVQVDGRRYQSGYTVDAYCLKRPGARQGHVYLKAVREFYRRYGSPDELAFLFGFPGVRHMRLGRLRLQFADPVLVPVWRRPAQARRLWWPRYTVETGGDEATIDTLWRQAARRYSVSAVRDGEWARRRYLSRPGNRYRHLTLWRRGTVHAWAVLDTAQDVGRWVELVWDGADPKALVALDEAVAGAAAGAGAKTLELWLAGDAAAAAVLGVRGWQLGHHPARLQMSVVAFDPGLDGADLLRRYYVTMGDSDLA